MKNKLITLILSFCISASAFAEDVFMGHFSQDPTIGTIFTKKIEGSTYWTFQEVFKSFTANISLDPASLGSFTPEGFASNLDPTRYGLHIYNNVNKQEIASYTFDDPFATQTLDLSAGTVVSFWVEYADGRIFDSRVVDIHEYSNYAIDAGDAFAYIFYEYGDKTKTPVAVITMGKASAAAPSGQPLPGILATILIAAGFLAYRFKRHKA